MESFLSTAGVLCSYFSASLARKNRVSSFRISSAAVRRVGDGGVVELRWIVVTSSLLLLLVRHLLLVAYSHYQFLFLLAYCY